MEKVTIVYTTDVHGFITSDSYFNNRNSTHGLAHAATTLNEIRAEGQEVIYFDNGDLISGSLLSIRCAEDHRIASPIISALNALKCQFAVIGNHEFDFGRKYLDKVIEKSEFPWLSANICKSSTTKPAFGPATYIHETKAGHKIGFIGITSEETASLVYKEHLKDLKIYNPIDMLREQIDKLKSENVDLLVVAYHGGYECGLNYYQLDDSDEPLCSEIATNFPEIDLLITGHTHGCTANKTINGVHTIQAGCKGMFIGRIDVSLEKDLKPHLTSKVIDVQKNKPDEKILEVTDKAIESTQSWLTEVVAHSKVSYFENRPLQQLVKPSRLMSLIHDVLKDHSKCDITLAHFWDITGWAKGEVKRQKILNLLPDNYLYVLNLSGQHIKMCLERSASFFSLSSDGRCLVTTKVYEYDIWSGIRYTIDISKPVGERIIELSHNGKNIDEKDKLKVAMYHFRAGGALGYDFLKPLRPIWKSPMTVREHLFKYLKDNENLIVPIENNFTVFNKDIVINEAFLE